VVVVISRTGISTSDCLLVPQPSRLGVNHSHSPLHSRNISHYPIAIAPYSIHLQGPKKIMSPRAHAHQLYDAYAHCESRCNRYTPYVTIASSQSTIFYEELEPLAPGPTTILFQPHVTQSPIRQCPSGLRTSICTSPIPTSLVTASSAPDHSRPPIWAPTECESRVGIESSACSVLQHGSR
jgi:hypothetical protein